MLRNPVRIKRLCVVMTAMLMVVLAAFPVFGKEVPDVNRQGSISLTLQDSQSGAYMENGAVTLYQVGEIRVDDGNYSWRLSGALAGTGTERVGGSEENRGKYGADWGKGERRF